jgi:hypothetical protein
MKFLQQPFEAKCRQILKIEFDKPAKVKLIEHSEFEKYKAGKTYNYRGGHFLKSPAEFEIPYDGVWHAIIEKGTHKEPIDVHGKAQLLKPRLETLNGYLEMETHQKYESKYDDTNE